MARTGRAGISLGSAFLIAFGTGVGTVLAQAMLKKQVKNWA
jgi:hypothetical protein